MKQNKYAVITGGSDGIGYAIAEEFARIGVNVCVVGRSEEKLKIASDKLKSYGIEVISLAADLTQMSAVENLAKEIQNIMPQVDILVNNAGIGNFIPFADMNETILDLHLNLNVKAPYLLTQYLLESLKKSKGNVINISSYFANRMLAGRATTAYSLTKGAINSFTKALAFELGPLGIRVNAVAPGSIKTEQFRTNLGKLTAEGRSEFHKMVKTIYPLERIGESAEVAKAVVFLSSDDAQWITGSIMSVDGGLTTN